MGTQMRIYKTKKQTHHHGESVFKNIMSVKINFLVL